MTIDGLGVVQSETSKASAATSKDVMGKNEFMTLLVAQLQNQDPLNPMDSTGFTAQLAQFSSLEQLQNVNTNLSDLSATQSALNNAQAVGFIGKTVSATGSQFEVNNGQTPPILFELNADAEIVKIGIYDAAGNHLRTLEGGKMTAGEQTVDWDGVTLNGNSVPDGIYEFEILAVDADDQIVDTTTYTNGKVTGVNYKNGVPYLLANQIEIPLSSVISVAEPADVE
jgi:flagellar basal-body rod modification protein FlgD